MTAVLLMTMHPQAWYAMKNGAFRNTYFEIVHYFFLEQTTAEFLHEFRASFPDASITPKMHLLEDHTLEWVRNLHLGFGFLGERELNLYMPDSMLPNVLHRTLLQCTTDCST